MDITESAWIGYVYKYMHRNNYRYYILQNIKNHMQKQRETHSSIKSRQRFDRRIKQTWIEV